MQELKETDLLSARPEQALLFKLPAFEGPLDLLLHLIKENKIDIYDIPIARITQQYLEYIDLMKELSLEIAGEFLVMAATLIQIKSKLLLPPDEKPEGEEAEDPRTELVRRLLEYQVFKDASVTLKEKEDIWRNIFHRPPVSEDSLEPEQELMLFEASIFDLLSAFKNMLSKAPVEIKEITRETLTVTDRINFIMERIEKEDSIKFEAMFEGGYTRVVLIVTFLALLEVIRLGLAKAYQESAFGTVWIINPAKTEEVLSVEF
ncbi:MAG: segregation/condensation protein A [Nitrospirae bacterium]|nr:segregation/condensation protein A [Nitrospirota bacterium]